MTKTNGNDVPEQPLSKSNDTKSSRITTKKIIMVIIPLAIVLIVMESAFAIIRHRGVERVQLDANDKEAVGYIVEAPNGDLWVRNVYDVWQFEKRDINSFTVRDDIFSTGSYVSDFAVAPNGSYWWIYDDNSPSQHVVNLNGETRKQYSFSERVNVIAIEPNSIVWLGTENGAMRLIGNHWQTFTHADGLTTNDVEAIAFSPEGGVWFAGSGVNSLSYFDGENFTKANGLAENITTIAIDLDGVLWAGTRQGISRFDGNEWTTYTTKVGLRYVDDIAIGPDKTIWVNAYDGISQFDGDKFRILLPLSSTVGIADLFVDDQNNLWVASFNESLFVYDTSRITMPIQLFGGWQLLRKFLGGAIIILLISIVIRESKVVFISLIAGLLAGGIVYFVVVIGLLLASGGNEGAGLAGIYIYGPGAAIITATSTFFIVFHWLSKNMGSAVAETPLEPPEIDNQS